MKKVEEMMAQERGRAERGAVARGSRGKKDDTSSDEEVDDDENSSSDYEIGVLALEVQGDDRNEGNSDGESAEEDLCFMVMAEVPDFYATHYIIHKSKLNREEVKNLVRDNLCDIFFTIIDYPDRWMMVMDDSDETQERWLRT